MLKHIHIYTHTHAKMHAYIHLHKRIITNMLQASIQLQELQARMDKEEKYKADVQVCVCTFP